MIKAIILDFDGVIVESNDVKTQAFRELFGRYPEHLDAMMAFHHANMSASRFMKFDHLLHLLGRTGDQALRWELAEVFSRRTKELVATVPFVAGARELIERFKGRVPMYLASVTPEEDLREVLEARGLAQSFACAYGCPPWTKPGAVRDVLSRERCAPTDAVLIGDSPGDLAAATETGVAFVRRDSGIKFRVPVEPTFRDLVGVADHLSSRLA